MRTLKSPTLSYRAQAMKKSAIYLWTVVIAQTLLLLGVLGLRVHYSKFPHLPVTRTRAEIHGGIKTALEIFKDDCGRYPTTAEGWKILIEPPTYDSLKNWRGPYLDLSAPPKDPWGCDYVYRFPGVYNTNGYDLYSCGADGISKSSGNDLDDINSWDETSPHGGLVLDSYYGEKRFGEVATILLLIPLLFGARLVAEEKSPQVREVVVENRVADAIWILILIVALIIWFSAVAPRIAER